MFSVTLQCKLFRYEESRERGRGGGRIQGRAGREGVAEDEIYIQVRGPDGGRRRRGISGRAGKGRGGGRLLSERAEQGRGGGRYGDRTEGGSGGVLAIVLYLDRAWPPRLTWAALKPIGLPVGSS